jgi:hypothetical protein
MGRSKSNRLSKLPLSCIEFWQGWVQKRSPEDMDEERPGWQVEVLNLTRKFPRTSGLLPAIDQTNHMTFSAIHV